MVFLNKLDRPGASFSSSLTSLLLHRLHHNPMAITLPIASFDPTHYNTGENGIEGLVDLVKWELWKYDEEGNGTSYPIPRNTDDLKTFEHLPDTHPVNQHLVSARTQMLENLSMSSDELMEQLLDLPSDASSYLSLESSTIMPHLRQASLDGKILPVLCGSAMKHIGSNLVLDYIGELLASPLDIALQKQEKMEHLQMLAWKVVWDDKKGWMTFVRVYSGRANLSIHCRTLNNITRQPDSAKCAV